MLGPKTKFNVRGSASQLAGIRFGRIQSRHGSMSSTGPNKRRRLDNNEALDPAVIRGQRAAFLSSMSRAVSPPPSVRFNAASQNLSSIPAKAEPTLPGTDFAATTKITPSISRMMTTSNASTSRLLPSPFTLTKIRDLPSSDNLDTVTLHDILGNPLIQEAWVFNFCFDVDWMMTHFDPDVRSLVNVQLIHGSWRREDANRLGIEDACKRWPNVQPLSAYLPDPFGTHHSKMFVLFTHDEQAEVIIHTANMLEKDWTNMSQAVWRSGPLKKVQPAEEAKIGPIGSGSRFKYDLMEYLKRYRKAAQGLDKKLKDYDFSAVRGALVASVPSKRKESQTTNAKDVPLWGHLRLQEVVQAIGREKRRTEVPISGASQPHLVCQVSSIATLASGWLDGFRNAAMVEAETSPKNLSIIYPTAPNVARSLDGYMAGGSIHAKAQSNAHLQQINSMRQQLSQWTRGSIENCQSRRHLAAPHIKTYIKFKEKPVTKSPDPDIEWALLTSANLSTQAWGSLPKLPKGSKDKAEAFVHIQSYEIGVLVWPELFQEDADGLAAARNVRMRPVFGRDDPEPEPSVDGVSSETVVGLRMPYDLPLTPYGVNELPWSPQSQYTTPDSHGRLWQA